VLFVAQTIKSGGRRCGVLAVGFLIAVASLASASARGQAPVSPELARPADDFVDSVGVNTHLHYAGTVYDTAFDRTIRPKLLALGVRHVRDGAYTYDAAGASTTFNRRCRSLAASGIRFDFLTTFRTQSTAATDLSKLGAVSSWCARAVESFEGTNEPDKQALPAGSGTWQAQTIASQKALYAAVKRTAGISNVAVLGPAIANSPTAVGSLSAFMDFGNWHPYPGGLCPACADVYGQTLDMLLPRYRTPSGPRPMIATETGYHNAVKAAAPSQRAVSELAAGRYMPRLLLDQFNRGFVRSYIYELIDERADPAKTQMDANFGLLRNDGSEKPAYRGVRSLLGLLSDPGSPFTPGALSYSLTGQVATVRHALLQKRNGSFYFALWQERSSYDTGARANAPDNLAARGDLPVSDQAVTLNVQNPIARTTVYTLDDAGTMTSTPVAPVNGSIALPVSDRVTVVELDPPAPVVAASNEAPQLTKVRVTPRRFSVRHRGGRGRAGRSRTPRGTRFVYTLSEAAAVKIAIDRMLPGRHANRSKRSKCVAPSDAKRRTKSCRRYRWVVTLRASKEAGRRATSFTGIVHGRALKAGRYRARITATDSAGAPSPERRVRFTIVRR
jgi:hypothetical protein